jgi:EAL domain-containing protein (putative c-di-GMP-specific phosphodiesterase class I)/ActR/RegA family two-component response regulator
MMNRVLLIDDDPMMGELLSPVLTALGMDDVTIANDGDKALQWVDNDNNKEQPALILCDLRMPGMDGIRFLRHLSERHYQGEIVIMSGGNNRLLETVYDLGIARQLDIRGALVKPITSNALAKVLKSHNKASPVIKEESLPLLNSEDLARGLRAGEIVTQFQPKVDITTRKIDGVETLVRWYHKDLGLIAPDRFIPIAEHSRLIDELTETVIYQALRNAAAWRKQGLRIPVAVNVSVHNLQRLDLPDWLVSTATSLGVELTQITIEVTESRLMENLADALEILTRLSLQGVNLSIDDFGTGYASLDQLRRIPFNELKIDRSFVSRAHYDTAAMAILESSVGLGKKLGMSLVAEGVESRSQWQMVEKLGCHKVQGFYVSKAMNGSDIPSWIEVWDKTRKFWH